MSLNSKKSELQHTYNPKPDKSMGRQVISHISNTQPTYPSICIGTITLRSIYSRNPGPHRSGGSKLSSLTIKVQWYKRSSNSKWRIHVNILLSLEGRKKIDKLQGNYKQYLVLLKPSHRSSLTSIWNYPQPCWPYDLWGCGINLWYSYACFKVVGIIVRYKIRPSGYYIGKIIWFSEAKSLYTYEADISLGCTNDG